MVLTLPYGAPVLCSAAGGPPLYGRLRKAPRGSAAGLLYVRLTADHGRARKGQSVYVRASGVRAYRPGRHASGVRTWGPAWMHGRRKRR